MSKSYIPTLAGMIREAQQINRTKRQVHIESRNNKCAKRYNRGWNGMSEEIAKVEINIKNSIHTEERIRLPVVQETYNSLKG